MAEVEKYEQSVEDILATLEKENPNDVLLKGLYNKVESTKVASKRKNLKKQIAKPRKEKKSPINIIEEGMKVLSNDEVAELGNTLLKDFDEKGQRIKSVKREEENTRIKDRFTQTNNGRLTQQQ